MYRARWAALVTKSMDKILLKAIIGRLKAYTILFMCLFERHDLLLYRNQLYVSLFIDCCWREMSVPLCSDNGMPRSSQMWHLKRNFSGTWGEIIGMIKYCTECIYKKNENERKRKKLIAFLMSLIKMTIWGVLRIKRKL